MDSILKTLQDVEGVNGAFVADTTGQLLSYRAHAVYDADLLRNATKFVNGTIDSVKLIQPDWSGINAQYPEGKLLIRNLSENDSSNNPKAILVVIADNRINISFAGVAVRVAVGKLKELLQRNPNGFSAMAAGNPSVASAHSTVATTANNLATGSGANAPGRQNQPDVAGSGLSWSGMSGSSSMSATGVTVADAASSEYLTLCTKALARSVGPLAKILVKEAVRKVCPDRPFSRDYSDALLAELVKNITKPGGAEEFRANVKKNA